MTADVAQFLLSLLGTQQLNVGAADFEETVKLILKAREQLEKVADG